MAVARWRSVMGAVLLAAASIVGQGCAAGNTPQAFGFLEERTPVSLSVADPSLATVYGCFDPTLRPYLRSVPIVTSTRAQTSYSVYRSDGAAFIALSADFFRAAGESRYWPSAYSKPPYGLQPDEPVFSDEFRRELLTHELMHIAQAHLKRDTPAFFADVTAWYQDESTGRPMPADGGAVEANRTKYILWWNVYGQAGAPADPSDDDWAQMDYCLRYRSLPGGLEEFAYIGDTILCAANTAARQARLNELSDAIFSAYQGVISPEVLALRQRN